MRQIDSTTPLLRIERATVSRGGFHILDDLNLEIAQGEHTAIIGPNGSGKSSLIKLITRDFYPLANVPEPPVVSVLGRESWDVFELRALMGIVSSGMAQWFQGEESLPGLEVVVSGFFASHGLARNHQVTPEMWRQAEEALTRVDALHLAKKSMLVMSTGEARRVLIARALVRKPVALLLDEPTSGLDIVARRRFLESLRGLAHEGTTLILVTHHAEEVFPEIGRVVLMNHGKIFADGPTEEMLTGERLSSLFGTRVEVRSVGSYYQADVENDSGV